MIKTLYPTFQRWSEKGSVYLISDTHFDDADCLLMDPNWPTPEEYKQRVFTGITKNDTLIHLGDVGKPDYFGKLKCHKVLLLGNHDQSVSRFRPYFDEIYEGPLMIAEKILLSHEPVDTTWAYNIHGHDHDPNHKQGLYHFNCAANVVGFKKINLKVLIQSGALKNVASLHRQTIDVATDRKDKRVANEKSIESVQQKTDAV